MAAYLFAHFIGEGPDGEQIYFSVSQDGLHWQDLNGGRPVLRSSLGSCGVRDPFLVRHPENGKIYLMATDLCIGKNPDWTAAQESGSRDLIVWETEDLVHWSRERACTVGLPEAGCVWAPEAVYDREKKAFFVFFASRVRLTGDKKGKQRIYAAYTEDFRRFSETFLYIEKACDIIDTTILESGGRYYRVSKDEMTNKLILETSDALLGTYTRIDSPDLEALEGVEGPEGYLLPDGRTWCLIADQFRVTRGYLPMVTSDLASGTFRILGPEEYDLGRSLKRHGGILPVTEEEYKRLISQYGDKAESPQKSSHTSFNAPAVR